MPNNAYEAKIAQIRDRFSARLPSRILTIAGLFEALTAERDIEASLQEAHRCAHEISGVAPILGFPQTGQAAQALERQLLLMIRAGLPVAPDALQNASGCFTNLQVAALKETGQAS